MSDEGEEEEVVLREKIEHKQSEEIDEEKPQKTKSEKSSKRRKTEGTEDNLEDKVLSLIKSSAF